METDPSSHRWHNLTYRLITLYDQSFTLLLSLWGETRHSVNTIHAMEMAHFAADYLDQAETPQSLGDAGKAKAVLIRLSLSDGWDTLNCKLPDQVKLKVLARIGHLVYDYKGLPSAKVCETIVGIITDSSNHA